MAIVAVCHRLWLKATQMYYVAILEVRIPRWVSMGWNASAGRQRSSGGSSREFVTLPFRASGGCLHCWARGHLPSSPKSATVAASLLHVVSPDPASIATSSLALLPPLWSHWSHSDNPGWCLSFKVSRLATFIPPFQCSIAWGFRE